MYQYKILTAVLAAAERADECEIDDGLCELIASTAMARESDEDYSHFSVDVGGDRVLSFRTSDRSNEVGLRLWPSAELFTEFHLAVPEAFREKRVLELGAGLGLCGIALAAACGARVVLTDGDARVLANLRHNASINGLPERDVRLLDWDETDKFFAAEDTEPYDIAFAADCAYDVAFFPALAFAIDCCLKANEAMEIYLANAARNEETWASLLAALSARDCEVACEIDVARVVKASGGPRAVSQRVWNQHEASASRGELRLVRIARRRPALLT